MLVKSLTLLRAQKRERICRKKLLVLSYFEKLYHFECHFGNGIMPFFRNFWSLLAKCYSRCIFMSFIALNLLSRRKFFNEKNNDIKIIFI